MLDVIEIKDVKVAIGTLVKALRKQKGMSQQELSEAIGSSRTTIQNLEIGKNFTVDTILKVLREMDMLADVHREVTETQEQVVNAKSLY